MTFGSRSKVKKAKNVRARLNGVLLQKVPSYKYLGLILDPILSYNKHVSYVIKTVLYKMSLLGKLRKYLHDNVALQIYKSMLLPYFDYADVIFSNSNVGDLEKLQRLQNKCLRLCNNRIRDASTDRLHKVAKTPFWRRAHVLNFMYIRKDRLSLLNVREIRTRAHDTHYLMCPSLGVKRSKEVWSTSAQLSGTIWMLKPEIWMPIYLSNFLGKKKC